MKLKRITLKNFKTHQNSVVEFDEFVNTIEGLNNSGKSNLIQAILLITGLQEDFPVSWIRYGEKECIITGEFENITVIRKRTKSTQKTIIGDQEFDGIASALKYIREKLGYQKVTLENEDINLNYFSKSNNFQPLNGSPEKTLKRIISLTGGDILEISRTHYLSVQKKLLKAFKEECDSIDKSLKFIEQLESKKEVVDKFLHELENVVEKESKVTLILDKKVDLQIKTKDYLSTSLRKVHTQELLQKVEDQNNLLHQNSSLIQLTFKVLELEKIKNQQSLNTEILILIKQALSLISLKELKSKIKEKNEHLTSTSKCLSQYKDDIQEIDKVISSLPICPTCGQPT